MKTIAALVIFGIFFNRPAASAQATCDTATSFYTGVKAVNYNDLICLSKNAGEKKTLLFTFGSWCVPCRYHLPNAIKLAKDYDLNFYVLLTEEEKSIYTKKAVDYLTNIDSSLNILVLKDKSYGVSSKKKYNKFLSEITPAAFENINDMSKYIIINNQGVVIMVTNWKDNRRNDWKDDSKMIQDRIVPVLKQE